ncbi:MAG: hypothetical protein ACKO3W_01730, partial [bacterium]
MRSLASIVFAITATCTAHADDLTLFGSIGSPQGAPYDVFASDVALADPATLIVGVRGADAAAPGAGAVEVFSLTSEGWDRVSRPTFTGLAAGDQLGESVAARADWFAAGASRHDARGADAGAVMLGRRVDGNWSHVATLLPPFGAGARFGSALSMSVDRLAVGAPRAPGGGFVDIYVRSGVAWTLETRIVNPTPSAANRFGESLSLFPAALVAPLLVIDAPTYYSFLPDAGSARIYRFESGVWNPRAVLVPANASDRTYFGQSVAVAAGVVAVGAYATVGGTAKAPLDEAGSVEIFGVTASGGDAWTRLTTLHSPNPETFGSFGWDIALERRSAEPGMPWTLLVGEPGAAAVGGAAQAGRVHCLQTSDPGSWEFLASARLSPASTQAVFGAAITMADGMSVFAAPGASVSGSPRGLAASLDLSSDCDSNGIPDTIDIANGAADSDGDGLLDACEPQYDVPGVYPTIQAAIDAVPTGTARTITVAPGVYNETFSLNGKNVVVRGASEAPTVLNGAGLAGSIARCTGGEPSTAGLEKLVFRHGTVGSPINPPSYMFTGGGALFGRDSSAFVRDCRFEQCAADFGAAVYMLRCTLLFEDCVFMANTANFDGGGLQTYASSGIVRRSTFTGNRCAQVSVGSGSALKGVGIRSAGTVLVLEDCRISSNPVPSAGAAVEYFENAKVLAGRLRLVGTEVVSNIAETGASADSAGLRIIGSRDACVLSGGTVVCGNTPRNVQGAFLAEGGWEVCDCLADVFVDGVVSAADLGILLASWGLADAQGLGDVNHDGIV